MTLPLPSEPNPEKDKGGRILAGKRWRLFFYVVEVAVESPKNVSQEEAAEDADEFMSAMSRSMGRVHESFASITRVEEFGNKMPPGGGVVIKREYPTGEKAKVTMPRGIAKNADYAKLMKKPKKAVPKKDGGSKKKKNKKKTTRRY